MRSLAINFGWIEDTLLANFQSGVSHASEETGTETFVARCSALMADIQHYRVCFQVIASRYEVLDHAAFFTLFPQFLSRARKVVNKSSGKSKSQSIFVHECINRVTNNLKRVVNSICAQLIAVIS